MQDFEKSADAEAEELVRRYFDKLSIQVASLDDARELMNTFRQIPRMQFQKCIYFIGGGEKSERKLASAAKSYGIGSGEAPLACFDNTAFGGAEDGCLLTTQAVCIHNLMEDVIRIPYDRVNEVETKGFIKKDIYVNGYKLDTNLMESGDVEPFALLIQLLTIKFLRPEFNVARGQAQQAAPAATYDAGALQQYLNELRHSARKFDFRKSLYYWDNTEKSNKKIMGAIQNYAHLTSGEQPLLCFDNTVFGTADVGALITTRGVYLKNQMKTEQFFGFDLMVIAELRGAFIKDVYINDMKLDTTCMDDDDKEGFVEFINLMAKQFGGR